MQLNPNRIRQYLKSFDFAQLFINELGWDVYRTPLNVMVNQHDYTLRAVAQKRGFVAYVCPPGPDGAPPVHSIRGKIEHQVNRSVREHLIIFVDGAQTTQIWQWVRREPGKLQARREHHYHVNQSGEALIQKLRGIAFSLEEEEGLTLVDVIGGARAAFDVERVTRRFYDLFKKERDAFHKFLSGIPAPEMQRWYVSVMLNRLMFIYFFQRKGFLNGNENYLRDKLAESQGQDRFYGDFLRPLFFEGFAKKEAERPAKVKKLLGTVPYLNGSLFSPHEIEDRYGSQIQIKDAAFERLFKFFDEWHWHLDERPLRNDREINPDVLGYIFEKYINQKQMGAYYTKEDITEYIAKNTIIPFLFDEARKQVKIAFEGQSSIWDLLPADPDRYIYDPLKKGVEYPLPSEIEVGVADVSQRTLWNTLAPEEFALPTEIWREVVQRRRRYQEVKAKLAGGEIRSINDFITYNLNLRQFAQDVIESCEGPELLRAFYKAIENVTILDPTVGSGAFLFAALNILEPLYEACIERMASFVADYELAAERPNPARFKDFRETLARIKQHPNRRYFIFKSIIVNNLFGVDIMAEAVEICKLRLFLKLVAQVERIEQVEPLPDIDFNIRAGNTLVGYATYEEVKRALTSQGNQMKLLSDADFTAMDRFEEKAADVDRLFQHFRQQQTELGGQVTATDKQELRRRLKGLEDELNEHLARDYGVDSKKAKAYQKWLESHQPFHWFIEFFGILKQGGFDVIIGNPPWKEYSQIKKIYEVYGYVTEKSGNLYALCAERAINLRKRNGLFSFIVQLPLTSSSRMISTRKLLREKNEHLFVAPFDDRPGKLFDGLQHCRSTIFISQGGMKPSSTSLATTRYQRWFTEARPNLFEQLEYTQLSKDTLYPDQFPKYAGSIEESIFDKVKTKGRQVVARVLEPQPTEKFIFYQEATQYWVKATVGLPHYAKNGVVGAPAHGRYLYFPQEKTAHSVCALLYSSLFYLYFIAYSDCFHLSHQLVSGFPISEQLIKDNKLIELNKQLMVDLQANAQEKSIRTKEGDEIAYAEFYVSKSKAVIDEIDHLLTRYYDFTQGELDFIINYDIKYRMGLGNSSGENEDENEDEA